METDVAVVGGGVVGCAAAYWLRRLDPGLDLVLLEARTLAAGASGRNAGFLLQGSATCHAEDVRRYGADRAARLWRFTKQNRDLVFSELDSSAIGLEPCGSLTVAGTAAEEEALSASAGLLRRAGEAVAFWSAARTNAFLNARGFHGALYVPDNAALHPVRLVHTLAAASAARIFERTPVEGIRAGDGVVLLETPAGRVRAGRVLLALNAYLPRLAPELAAFVRPVRAQMLAAAPPRFGGLPCPVYSHEGYFYIRQEPGGRLLLGGARHLHRDAEIGYEDATTPALQADLEAYLERHFQELAGGTVALRWSGTMGFSPDHLPVVGRHPEVPNAHWAAGFSGHGMGYAFRMGRLLAERLLGEAEPEGFDLFSAARFGGSTPVPDRTSGEAGSDPSTP